MKPFDAIIIGAGPNGLAAALALASPRLKRRLRVALVDQRDPRLRSTEDTRGTAVTLATRKMFETLGLWQSLGPHAQDMRSINVTDGGAETATEKPVLLSFTTTDAKPAAAAIVENRHLLSALIETVAAIDGIELQFGSSVQEFHFGPGLAQLVLSNGTTLKAQLIVGADGRNSRARTAAEIKTREKPYGQNAITFSLAHELPHEGRAEEHFTSDGVLALLPLPGLRSSIVWAMNAAHAEQRMNLDDAAFLADLQATIGTHLGALSLASKRQSYPLGQLIAESAIAPRLALIGDAAHVIHPLAGLGLNLGFKDAAALADCLAEAQSRGEDLGSLAVLENYARARRFDTLITSTGIDAMNALFANANPVLKAGRDLGLMMVNRLPFVKDALMREAAGTSGPIPRLMRGLHPS